MSAPDLSLLPDMVLVDDEPVFNEPWEAHAFAMTLSLHQKGVFSWGEWADALSKQIHSGTDRPYYRHWLAALENLLASKRIASPDTVAAREQAWHAAAARTPHGEPIIL